MKPSQVNALLTKCEVQDSPELRRFLALYKKALLNNVVSKICEVEEDFDASGKDKEASAIWQCLVAVQKECL